MDLEELKDLWQQEKQSDASGEQHLKDMLAAKSKSPVAIMKRNLLTELLLVIITYGISIVFYFTAWKGKMSEVAWFMLGIALIFVVYYYRKNKLLEQMSSPAGHVRQHLENQITTLERFVRFYLLAGKILIPVSMIFFGWIFYLNARYISPANIFFPSQENPVWKVILVWSVLIILITFVLSIVNKWYVQKLYGIHISKLKAILHEMEEEDTAEHEFK